jgi:hypothetical protein
VRYSKIGAPMSALGQKRTRAPQRKSESFNQLVGAIEQLRRDCQTECFCGLKVDNQLEFCRLLSPQILLKADGV